MIDWKPRTTDKAVIIATDENYFPYACCLAWQIASQSGPRDFDVLLISEQSLLMPPIMSDLGVDLINMYLPDVLAQMPFGRFSRAAYLRMHAAEALADRYRRLLYLDSDILFEGGDLSRLLDIDLQGAAVGAVVDVKAFIRKSWRAKEFRLLGMEAAPYLNAGVLLIDTKEYGDQRISERAVDVMSNTRPDIFVYFDQTLLNVVLHGDLAELSPVWNWQMNRRLAAVSHDGRYPVAFRHFITLKKPFLSAGQVHDVRFSEAYRNFFRIFMPDALPLMPDRAAVGPFFDAWQEIKLFLKRFWCRRVSQRYLAQFPTEWSVLRHKRASPFPISNKPLESV